MAACTSSWRGPTPALGQKEKAEELLQRAQALQQAAQERNAAAAQRAITAPK